MTLVCILPSRTGTTAHDMMFYLFQNDVLYEGCIPYFVIMNKHCTRTIEINEKSYYYDGEICCCLRLLLLTPYIVICVIVW